jgi:hypothetical protein
MVDGGPAAVMITLSCPPDCATENECESLPATATVPEKVSVVAAAVSDVVDVAAVLALPVHAVAATVISTPTHTASRVRARLRREPLANTWLRGLFFTVSLNDVGVAYRWRAREKTLAEG